LSHPSVWRYGRAVHVVLSVSDLTRAVGFYEGVFGWPRNARIDFANYVELHPPEGGTLALYERNGYAQQVGAEPAELNGRRPRRATCTCARGRRAGDGRQASRPRARGR
jgi:catechol 2,3-dioxygenase-like lactoylglutathione lyase family enzyme